MLFVSKAWSSSSFIYYQFTSREKQIKRIDRYLGQNCRVLITSWLNDKILGYHFLVPVEHHNHATLVNQKVVTRNFIIEHTGDKYLL